jgi:hypothetical protein
MLCYNGGMKMKKIFNSLFGKQDRPPVFPDMPEKPLLLAQAKEIFDKLAGMEDIAHGYPREGCYARAHLMCRKLFGLGLAAKKAWAFEEEGGDLLVERPDGSRLYWYFHVAPVLPVIMEGDKKEYMVFDPSLFDGPVTVQKWGETMKAPSENTFVANCGTPPPGHKGDYDLTYKTTHKTDRIAQKTMCKYLPLQNKDKGLLLASGFDKLLAAAAAVVPKKEMAPCLKPAG